MGADKYPIRVSNMKRKEWLEQWSMKSLKIKAPFLEAEFGPSDPDRNAAWDLYVELLTRIATQELGSEQGVEKTALDSVYSIFGTTRAVLKHHGRGCSEFAIIAIVVLNQKIRPFTAKWHKVSTATGFDDDENKQQFRVELSELQKTLRTYSKMLADMAGVEDLTDLEDT